MIFILADSPEISINKVINWLFRKKEYFLLCNSNKAKVIFSKIDFDHFLLKVNDRTIDSNKITGYWFKNGHLLFNKYSDEIQEHTEFTKYIREFEEYEMHKISEYIYYLLDQKNKIGSKFKQGINKLYVLDQARKCGLNVPDSAVIADSNDLFSNFGEKKVCTKSLGRLFSFVDDDILLCSYTRMVDTEIISHSFAPSFVQEYVEKEYEIRVFYIRGAFYAMAIFSQQSKVTETDFRRYAPVKNRSIPYKLPKVIEDKISQLMEILHLDTGSIDMIRAMNGNFYFLEVNPSGIFADVSYNCNYYIERTIANILMGFKE